MQNLGDLKANAQLLHGTCLATDGEQYTRLAETLTPDELGTLMNDYYEVLFAEVEASGGVVTDVVGDSMMAIWAAATPNSAMRSRACHGALAIAAAVARFNQGVGRPPLPTRIGLHSGPIRLGNIGGAKHVQFRAVGDIVNTASRIEGLNKLLGTRILVSADTLADVTGLVTRELGTFLLAGKSTPLVIHELLGVAGFVAVTVLDRNQRFQAALATFRAGDWGNAGKLFGTLLGERPDEGPVQFYVALCARYLEQGPDTFEDGVVRIATK
jgi:adenylate cyclase